MVKKSFSKPVVLSEAKNPIGFTMRFLAANTLLDSSLRSE
jgi:hypothetical protein